MTLLFDAFVTNADALVRCRFANFCGNLTRKNIENFVSNGYKMNYEAKMAVKFSEVGESS